MEITTITSQPVATNGNVLFTETVTPGSCSIIHTRGSGLVTLRGLTNQCRARFRVSFNGNVAIAPEGDVGEITLAVTSSGEPIGAATMKSTPAAVEEYANVSAATFIDVPAGCCMQIAVKNLSAATVNVINANLIVERVA